MERITVWVLALLSLTACAQGEDTLESPVTEAPGPVEMMAPQQVEMDVAGMVAPPPNSPDTDADEPPMSVPDPVVEPSDDPPAMMDEPADNSQDPIEEPDMDPADNPAQDPSRPQEPMTPPADMPAPPMQPQFQSLADLEPSPNNIPQCPATAPENPWGPCVGVPVYAVCDYGTQPAPFYTCICDWIHWICVGFQ